MPTRPLVPRMPATILARFSIWLTGVYGVVQGVGILLGGPGRWASPSFTLLRQTPGGTLSWGIVAIIAGAVILFGSTSRRWYIKAVGLGVLSIWAFAFGATALVTTFAVPVAATTAGPTYVLIAAWAAVLVCVDERRLVIGA